MRNGKIATMVGGLLLVGGFLLISCGNEEQAQEQSDNGLTEFELEHGIGPITAPMDIGTIDYELADEGATIFRNKCTACHQLEQDLVGPALGDVVERRSPEYIMNFILNPGEMTNRHPVGQELLQQYMSRMPFQSVTEDDARAILEHLRRIAED